MKQLSIFFVLIIFIVPTLESQNLFDLDENYGFKGYKFQISKSSFGNEEFENVENGGAEKCSITRKEYIGDIPVKGIELFFVDNKLSKVEVFFDLSYSQNLFDACKSAFGEPTGNNIPKDNSMRFLNSSERHYWEAQKVRLTHSYSNRISGANGPKLKLIFELKDYRQLQENYKVKKYTSDDF